MAAEKFQPAILNWKKMEYYNISINGTIVGWTFGDQYDKHKIISISNWGDLRLGLNYTKE